MAAPHQIIEYWKSTLKEDLAGFTDPGEEVTCNVSRGRFTVAWVQRGKLRKARFKLTSQSDFRWEAEDSSRQFQYFDFLTSESMADFGQLSKSMQKRHPQIDSYVNATATRGSDSAQRAEEADVAVLTDVTTSIDQLSGTTKVLFIKGDAGAGKTTLLEQLCRQQADKYIRHRGNFLFLYVSAKGRALSNLNDALSSELDELRAGFTRHALVPLVRRGLIVPIIDGFDELLGAAGYGDAFGSLSQFLSQIRGNGTLIVSARSSFYEVEFLGRATSDDAPFELQPITLNPWQELQISQYLAKRRGLQDISNKDKKILNRLSETDRKLLEKPFFASKFCEYVDAHELIGERVPLLGFLVEKYIERESEKIVDRDEQPLLSRDQHKRLFTEISDFMWKAGSREFNIGDLREVAGLVGGDLGLRTYP